MNDSSINRALADYLVIIPARKGSKGVPNKNKRLLKDKPLISWTIDIAISTGLKNIVVSSDDENILEIAKTKRVSALKRPNELAQDNTPMIGVIDHCIDNFGKKFKAILLLQPTSPFRTSEQIIESIKLFESNKDCDGVISVRRLLDGHPSMVKKISSAGFLEPFCIPEDEGAGRNNLKPYAYIRTGSIYLIQMSHYLKNKTVKSGRILPLIMEGIYNVNIDEEIDFLTAQVIANEFFK